MFIDSWILYAALAAFAVAVALCGLLIFACIKVSRLLTATRQLSADKTRRIKALQEELQKNQDELEVTVANPSLLDLQVQLEETREHHEKLQGDPALQEHLLPDAKLPLRVAALRYSVLSAEIEALQNSEQRWRTLDVKLGMLLKQMHSAETAAIPDLNAATPEPAINAELMGELQRLREVTSSQKDQINELEARLNSVSSHEEKDALLADMQKQLAQQTRYMHEADTCIQQVEEELTSTSNQLTELSNEHRQIKEYGGELEILIRDFSSTSRDMLQSIAILEKENRELRGDEMPPPATDSAGDSAAVVH